MRLGSSWRWQLSRAMRLALRLRRLCRPQEGGGRVGVRLSAAWRYGKLLLRSLYYNSLTNSDTLLDCAFEPVYWIVDNVTRWFGVVFVCLVVLLTSSVVIIVYLFVLPTIFSSYPAHWIAWHLCCGHWLLILVVFHYYKATTTSPGHPPKDKRDVPSVSICKKCITPKPPRTHHCSICSLCVLKMDHHCPWLNNCVGHLNHRYFFSFCLYMTLGCIYCSISSRNLFLDAYSAIETSFQTPPPDVSPRESVGHKCIIFLWVLTSSVAVALGGLTLWHAKLISRGETSVERHINRKEARRLQGNGKVFRNPYHHGRLNNWKLFFGVETRRLRNKRGKEEERKKVRDKGRTEESRKEGRQRKREGRKRGVKKALDRGRKKKESDQKTKSLADPGPAALQPSAQRGRPHVGPALHQQRPHDHLTSLLPSHRTAEEELCSDAFWELNMTQLEMFWLLQIQALSHFDDF